MLRSLCPCCFTEEDEMEGYLIRNASNDGFPTHSDSLSNFALPNGRNTSTRSSNSLLPSQIHPIKSVEDEETAQLNRILDQTQRNIIDVSSGVELGVGPDFMTRSAKYDELIKKHNKARSMTRTIQNDSNSTNLLLDCVDQQKVCDYLNRIPVNNLMEFRNLASEISSSIVDGISVQHREDLVVQMVLS